MDKDFKDIEQEGMVCEPVGSAAIADYKQNLYPEDEDLSNVPLGKYGFYTNDPEVFEKRVDEIEASLNEAEFGFDDPNEWIQVDDFMAAMRKEFSWL